LERCRRRLLLHLPLLLLRVPRMPFLLLRGPPRMRPLRLPERGGIPCPPLLPRFAGPDPVVPPPRPPRDRVREDRGRTRPRADRPSSSRRSIPPPPRRPPPGTATPRAPPPRRRRRASTRTTTTRA
jgi:hypothetical protein